MPFLQSGEMTDLRAFVNPFRNVQEIGPGWQFWVVSSLVFWIHCEYCHNVLVNVAALKKQISSGRCVVVKESVSFSFSDSEQRTCVHCLGRCYMQFSFALGCPTQNQRDGPESLISPWAIWILVCLVLGFCSPFSWCIRSGAIQRVGQCCGHN